MPKAQPNSIHHQREKVKIKFIKEITGGKNCQIGNLYDQNPLLSHKAYHKGRGN